MTQGVWPFHCHMSFHLGAGMLTTVEYGDADQEVGLLPGSPTPAPAPHSDGGGAAGAGEWTSTAQVATSQHSVYWHNST
jgi:hypothetical protein